MSKFWGVFLMPLITLGMFLLFLVIPNIDPLKANVAQFRETFNLFIVLIMAFMLYIPRADFGLEPWTSEFQNERRQCCLSWACCSSPLDLCCGKPSATSSSAYAPRGHCPVIQSGIRRINSARSCSWRREYLRSSVKFLRRHRSVLADVRSVDRVKLIPRNLLVCVYREPKQRHKSFA